MAKKGGERNNAKRLTCDILGILQERTDKEHPISTAKLKEILSTMCKTSPDPETVSSILTALRENYRGPGKVVCQAVEKENGAQYTHGHYLERDFTAEEVEMLLNDVMFSRMRTPAQTKTLIGKLKALASPYHKKNLAYVDFLPFSLYTANALVQRNIVSIQRVISGNLHNKSKETVIGFQFNGYGSDHEIHEVPGGKYQDFLPLKIFEAYGNYYVMGLRDGKKQPWNFRLDLITKLTSHERDKVKDDARERIARMASSADALSTYLTQHLYMAHEGEDERVETAYLRVEKIFYVNEQGEKVYYKPEASLTMLHDTFGRNYSVMAENDQYVDIRVEGVLWGITSFVRQYIDRVQVIKPEAVKAKVEKSLRESFEGYFTQGEKL